MRPAGLALIGAGLLLLAGCSSPVSLSLDPPSPSRPPPAAAPVQFAFEPVADTRPTSSRDNAGHVGGRPIVAAGLLAWIDQSLQALHGRAFTIRSAKDELKAWQVRPRLHQFYAASLDVSKNAQVVIELEFRSPAGETFTRVYRGRVNAVNWWNSAGEIDAALHAAAEDCFRRIASDLDLIAASPPRA